MKKLTITISTEVQQHLHMGIGQVIAAHTYRIILDFLLTVNGKKQRGLLVTMEARERGGMDERLRDEFIASARGEVFFYDEARDEIADGDQFQIETIDPQNVLKWLGIDTAVDIFKNQQNGKPLRLLA